MYDNRRFWDRMARLYAPIQEHSNRRLYEAVTSRCSPYLTKDTRVLELACGSGQLTIPLHGLAGSWEATDFSEKMVRETLRRCPQVSASVQDATALPYVDDSFDVVLIANALHIMPEPEKALAEIHRVLRPGGVILTPTFVYEGKINRVRMKLTELVGFQTYRKWTLQDLRRVLERSGFRVIEQALLPGDPLPEGFAAARAEK